MNTTENEFHVGGYRITIGPSGAHWDYSIANATGAVIFARIGFLSEEAVRDNVNVWLKEHGVTAGLPNTIDQAPSGEASGRTGIVHTIDPPVIEP